MAATTEQKVDFLLKKVGYSLSKTGSVTGTGAISGGTTKEPFAETIASPITTRSTSIWADSSYIPTTPPGSDTGYVKVYAKSSPVRMTVDSTVAGSRAFIAYTTYNNTSSAILGDWINTQFGADYIVEVYVGDPSTGTEDTDYFKLSAAGATGDDTWFFDYTSGILNFNGPDLPTGDRAVTDTNVYIVGYRYLGTKGVQPPGGIGTFHNLYVSGLSTFVGVGTFNNNLYVGGNLDIKGSVTLGDAATDNVVFNADVDSNIIPDDNNTYDLGSSSQRWNKLWVKDVSLTDLDVSGIGTFANGIDVKTGTATTALIVEGDGRITGILTVAELAAPEISIGSTGLITGPANMYIDPATVGDNTGLLVIKGNLQVDGTQTTVNSTTMEVADKNIGIASGSANDAAADGAGITVYSGDGNKTLNWVDSTDSWTSSEHFDLASGKSYDIAGTEIIHSLRATLGGTLSVAGVTTVKQLEIGTLGQTLVGITTILDEDDMSSDSAAALATQQSIKKYVDDQVTAQDLDFQADSGGALSIDLDSEVLGIVGTPNEIETTGSGNNVTIGLPDDVTIGSDLSVTDTLKIGANAPVGVTTVLDEDDMSSDSATALATQQSIKKYVDDTVTAQDLDFFGDSGGALSIDLDSESLELAGTANEITTVGSGNSITFGLPDDVTIGSDLSVTDTLKIGANAPVGVTTILDQDDMASDSATALATQQSIKAYVDNSSPGGSNLTVSADSGTNQAINLSSEVLDIEGTANEIETATGTNKVVIGLPDDVTIADDLTVTGDIASVTNIKATGIATITDAIDGDNTLDIAKQVSFASSLTVAGISTFSGLIDANSGLDITGVSTFVGNTYIGTAGTVFTALVGAAASVGIGSATPDYMLDVAGTINSETDVKIQGVSVTTQALNDAVAMAIALG